MGYKVNRITLWKKKPEWQPGANTLVYYPLDSTNKVNDLSGNSYTLTNGGNVTFGTQQGVDCATFNGTLASVLTQSSISFNAYPTYTASVWMYITGTSGTYQTIYVIGSVGGTGSLGSWFRYNTGLCIGSRHPSYESVRSGNINGAWHLLTNVVNGSSSIQYLDGQQYQTLTNSLTGTQTVLSLGAPSGFHQDDDLTGYLSNFILEDKARTAQDVADYYDQTKGDYGYTPVDLLEEYQIRPDTRRRPGAHTVAYYPLNSTNTVNDLSGNSYNLTNSGVTFTTQGGVDCASFGGSGYLTSESISAPSGGNARTVSFWCYNTSADTQYYGFYGEQNTDARFLFMIRKLSGGSVYDFHAGSMFYQSSFAPTINDWELITLTYENSTYTLYVNGTSVYTNNVTLNTTAVSSSYPFRISGDNQNGNNLYSGYLSNVIVEDVAWSAQNVSDYYNLTKGDYGIS